MKIKKIHVEIRTLDDTLREAERVYNAISKGKETSKKTAVYFSNVKDMSHYQILTVAKYIKTYII